MKRRIGLYVFGGILLLIVAIVVLNFTLRGNRYDTAIPVRVYTVATGTLQDRVSGNGTFKPDTAVNVTAQVSGEVQSIRVSENSVVTKGALLLTLRDDDYRLRAQKARAALDSTRNSIRQSLVTLRAQYRSAASALADAQRTFDNNKDLYASKSISQEAYQKSSDAQENATVSFQSVKEQLDLRCGLPLTSDPPLTPDTDDQIVERSPEVEQALVSLRSAQDSVDKCRITAPIAGTVTDVTPTVGDMVAPSTPLVRIETLSAMLAEIQIDEVDIGKIRMGQDAELTSDSLIGQTIKGTVVTIAPTVTSLGSTRASLVDLTIDKKSLPPGGAIIRSGASCTARIATNVKQGVLTIPLASFVTQENASSVYLLTPTGRKNASGSEVFLLSKKQIETGSSDVNFVEVTSGLSNGDRIAAGNLNLLRDGILVTARKE
jgi:HlyD family secretion protein